MNHQTPQTPTSFYENSRMVKEPIINTTRPNMANLWASTIKKTIMRGSWTTIPFIILKRALGSNPARIHLILLMKMIIFPITKMKNEKIGSIKCLSNRLKLCNREQIIHLIIRAWEMVSKISAKITVCQVKALRMERMVQMKSRRKIRLLNK